MNLPVFPHFKKNVDTIVVSRAEFERLQSIENAAKRFDRAGASVNQMSGEQWDAYINLKAFFHGGIAHHQRIP